MNTTVSKNKIREWTILAMFIAIVAVMGFVPGIGFITIAILAAVALVLGHRDGAGDQRAERGGKRKLLEGGLRAGHGLAPAWNGVATVAAQR